MESSSERIAVVEIAVRPSRSPRSVAIGPSRTGLAVAVAVDPADLGEQAGDLAEGEDDADQPDGEDQAVEAGIGEEGRLDLAVEQHDQEGRDDQEDHHPPQVHLRTRQLRALVLARHGAPRPHPPHAGD
jgi:hypothetical protein